MTQVVTVSATTAAYAAEALKPSARVRGDGPTDEAITLLSARRTEEPKLTPVSIPKTKGALPLSFMLATADGRLPERSEAEALRRYLEFMRDDDGGSEKQENEGRQDEPAGQEDESDAA
ncbi:hypothetical protein ACI2KT_10355 [Ensifer adhaerens]|uniref:Uncharacterized protein n=1 Tax=Ensifer adhaerens TaxID=106592 RepID=A0A9Q8YBU4_ENSAD|nr:MULTISPECIES: hypothetical protein [Ensifer]KSV66029.1 hypothetical protein N182_09830 [Sinorhizobium sp. GL2]KSV79596.1 hypothetical protein N185_00290 [Sinorhizobium sp. GW3]MBD9495489.1 hypothetical protein [Ensifer sp. ENS01]MBD9519141.1 hypothetical protein [Ensifer sp. ENS02]MBD9543728.1 hypothetical protein [Ensifer sp. ENS04]MBD9556096.1 hypothetical protein [Ensifer sp. ENS03]MBD9568872.1 hypothetical protein [Ensifer sp. ENS08]MBD9636113.1 hypothetical protein [Ensifer sp. ENS0